MHDSLAKTVHGIGFAALALSRRIEVDPPGAVEDARKLAADARTAAQEARELLQRPARARRRRAAAADRDPLRGRALGRADRRRASGGSLDDVGPLPSLALRELRWILKEALANVERYAHATRVDVHLRRLGDARRADGRRRRRRLRGRPTTSTSSRGAAPSACAACASARGWRAAT